MIPFLVTGATGGRWIDRLGTPFACITWNALNQLTAVSKNGANQASFSYDPLDRRVEKSAGASILGFVYDGLDWVRRTGGVSVNTVSGPAMDHPMAQDQSGVVTYWHADALGSIQKSTAANGVAAGAVLYDAWGNRNTEVGPYSFTGREQDVETGLYYYRARSYDPKIGRFLSEDPIAVPRRDTRELNPYAYVANNPVNETDPSGLAIWLCNRKAFTRFGPGNHTYFWDDRSGRCCGRGSQLECKEAGPPTDSCRKVEGSDGQEHKILACCRYNDWGSFRPISNDCHVVTNTCLAITGMKNPGAPGDRFGPPCDPCSK